MAIPLPNNLLADLGQHLIHIHGQHQHQHLLKKDLQLALVDAYGQHDALLEQIKTVFKEWQKIKKNHDALQKACLDKNNRKEFLEFQLSEFEKLDLAENEVEELDKNHKQLSNAESLVNYCQQSCNLLTEDEQSIESSLNHVSSILEKIKDIDPRLSSAHELVNNALIQISEAHHELNYYLESIDLSPEKLAEVETRLSQIHDLARKHHIAAKELKTFERKLSDELASLDNSDKELQRLENEMHTLEQKYLSLAKKLSTKRKAACKKLEKLITDDMQNLAMTGGKLSIKMESLEKQEPDPLGQERIEFFVASNPGQSLQPLTKVASGGELSRMSLAIQVNTAKLVATPSLIFDEVDTGIGGAVAEDGWPIVKKLKRACTSFLYHSPTSSRSIS